MRLYISRGEYAEIFWFKDRYPLLPESGFLSMTRNNEPNSGGQFQFISVQNADDRTAKRLARSNAVTRGLKSKTALLSWRQAPRLQVLLVRSKCSLQSHRDYRRCSANVRSLQVLKIPCRVYLK